MTNLKDSRLRQGVSVLGVTEYLVVRCYVCVDFAVVVSVGKEARITDYVNGVEKREVRDDWRACLT